MKSAAVVCAILAMSLTVGGSAFAQASNFESSQDANRNRQAQRNAPQDRRDNQARQPSRYYNQRHGDNYARQDERGAGPNHQFYRGGRLPMEYRSRQYVVNDWRGHHLSAPPRGYHWVQSGGDYILVAIATGVILQLLLSQ